MTKKYSFRKKKPAKIDSIFQHIFDKLPNFTQKDSLFANEKLENDIVFENGFGEYGLFHFLYSFFVSKT